MFIKTVNNFCLPIGAGNFRYGWVKDYCAQVDEHTFQCLICDGRIRMPPTSTGNMKRHIKLKHPVEYKKEFDGIRLKKSVSKSLESKKRNLKRRVAKSDDNESNDEESLSEIEIVAEDDSSYEQSETDEEIDDDLDKKIKDLCTKEVTTSKSNRKTCIWNFFENENDDNDNIFKCTFCMTNISIVGRNMSNLKRHIIWRHGKEYKRILKYAPKNDSLHHPVSRKSARCRNDYSDDDGDADSTQDVNIEEFLVWPDKESEKGDKDELEKKIQYLCNKTVTGKVRGKTCIWNFFENVSGDNIFRCTFCLKDVTIFPKSVSNLSRHISCCHKDILKKIYKYASPDDSLFRKKSLRDREDEEAESEKGVEKPKRKLDDEKTELIKYLCNKPVSGKHASKTCIWNFFTRIKPTVHKCIFCERKITLSTASGVANLRRHVMNLHKKEYEVIIKHAPVKDSLHRAGSYNFLKNLSCSVNPAKSVEFDKAYFNEMGDGKFVCKHCDETVECTEDDHGLLFSHIQDKHPDQVIMYQEQTVENEEFSVFIVKK